MSSCTIIIVSHLDYDIINEFVTVSNLITASTATVCSPVHRRQIAKFYIITTDSSAAGSKCRREQCVVFRLDNAMPQHHHIQSRFVGSGRDSLNDTERHTTRVVAS